MVASSWYTIIRDITIRIFRAIRDFIFSSQIEDVQIEYFNSPKLYIECEYCGMCISRCGCGKHKQYKDELQDGIIFLPNGTTARYMSLDELQTHFFRPISDIYGVTQ